MTLMAALEVFLTDCTPITDYPVFFGSVPESHPHGDPRLVLIAAGGRYHDVLQMTDPATFQLQFHHPDLETLMANVDDVIFNLIAHHTTTTISDTYTVYNDAATPLPVWEFVSISTQPAVSLPPTDDKCHRMAVTLSVYATKFNN